jgi:hypothetical protein
VVVDAYEAAFNKSRKRRKSIEKKHNNQSKIRRSIARIILKGENKDF